MTAERPMPEREYFARHPLLRTRDLDEARHRIAQTLCDHRLAVTTRNADLAVRHNAVRGLNLAVSFLSYGAEVTVDPGLLGSFYLLHVPLAGRARVEHRGEETVTSPTRAAILNPDRPARLQWGEACRKLLVQIDRTHLETVACALTGAPLPGPIRFDPAVDLTAPSGRRLLRIITACVEAAESGELFARPLRAGDLRVEHDLAHALLSLQPSNVSHILDRADQQARPRAIRLAIDYMHANLAEPITLSDIAGAAGVNIRTLQKGFQRLFGLTPMQVLRNVRLDAARYHLMARRDPPSVTEVAFSCGFSHLGRFSRDYRARFGHAPSEGRWADRTRSPQLV